jgi:quinoprotein glucose dehydrogenase
MPASRSILSAFVAVLLGLSGICLVIGGTWLVALGGSWYYPLAGLVLLADAWLLWLGHRAAPWLFALLFAASLAWALWEAGLDWWPLAARLDVLFLLGALMLLAALLHRDAAARGGRVALALVLAAGAIVAIASALRDPQEVAGTLTGPTTAAAPGLTAAADWTAYGGSGYGQRYSALRQLTPQNVAQLRELWHYHTGDRRGQPGDPQETTFEATPLKIGDRLFFCTPHQHVIALDAATGKEIWRFDPKIKGPLALQHLTCRGLSWQAASSDASCPSKLFMPTADGRLIALNPQTGQPCAGFGGGSGQIDLWQGMPNVLPGAYYSTSPVVVTRKNVIVGGTTLDNYSTHEPSGVIRAFDIETGQLVWNWDSANPEQTAPLPAGQTYTPNSPNSWSISAVDEALGMVYVPLGNQTPDQWGPDRSAAVERFSSAIVALDIATGQVRWDFQTVHHDLWDYDVPSQPSLLDLRVGAATVPVLVQPTKQGELFVLDRRSGQPVLPVREEPAPPDAVPPDHVAPTQPRSALSLDPETLTERRMWGGTMFDQLYCRIAFHRLRYGGRFTPPSLQGSLVYPGNFGVFNWGSIAVDPTRGWAFTTPAQLAFVSQLVPRPNDRDLVVQGKKPPQGSLPAINENFGAPYAVKLHPFVSPLGIPCQQPPWGLVAGADLASGRIVWRHRNGTVRDLAPVPLPFRMGVPSLGGPLVTAGGLAFLSGTLDYYVRGYDLATGAELWRSRLPAGGQATPMTYEAAGGRQVLLVVAGGHGSVGTRAGDDVIAYALPSR